MADPERAMLEMGLIQRKRSAAGAHRIDQQILAGGGSESSGTTGTSGAGSMGSDRSMGDFENDTEMDTHIAPA